LELCLDTDGFWLEPHTDIGAKKLTLLISLSQCGGLGHGPHDTGRSVRCPGIRYVQFRRVVYSVR
jgi:hypothetical protein